MQLYQLGDTPLKVSRIGLGLAALGRPGYINLGHAQDLKENYDPFAMEMHARQVLDTAWKMGIRYFDTARSYGKGELFLGNWLRERDHDPDTFTVGSKWGYTYTADWQVDAEEHEVKEHSVATLDRQWKESQQALGPYLDLYQIHSATLESGVLDNTGVLSRLASLKAEGIYIGLSVSGDQQAQVLQKALAIKVDGQTLFNTVQATYNLLETSTGPLLQEAHDRGMGVIIKEALANGRLTSRNVDPAFKPQLNLLRQEADLLDTTIDALALAAILAEDWADVVLSGAAQTDHLLSNIKALDLPWTDELGQRLQVLREAPEAYWTFRKGLAWN